MSAPRLGVYVDDVYRVGRAGGVSVDRAFLLFACAVGSNLGGTTVFGRTVESEDPSDYALPGVRLVRLPYYEDLKDLGATARTLVRTVRGMWRGLSGVDVVWVFGPHPFALLLVALARLRGRRVVLGVRQDTVAYARTRFAGRRGAGTATIAVRVLDAAFRLLGRVLPTATVGEELARAYGSRAFPMTVTLVPASALVDAPRPAGAAPWRLLTVGRVDTEKNPFLLVEALAELERREPGSYALTWVGRGPMEDEVLALARERGVADAITMRGYVPFGDQLLDLYREADVFVHVSLTEGVPQVLIEAFTAGTPCVATAVGGVPRATADGEAALLVPPDDRDALVDAVARLAHDEAERARVAGRALELARTLTLEAESARVAAFVSGR